MSSFSSRNHRGAKARRTTNQPVGRMPSPEYHQEQANKTTQDHRAPQKGSQSPTSLMRPNRTRAEAARSSPSQNTDLAVKLPTYHIVARDPAVPYPFATNPHLLITGRYSGSNDNQHEPVHTRRPSRTSSYQGAAATLPYGGAYSDSQKARRQLVLHRCTRRHCLVSH